MPNLVVFIVLSDSIKSASMAHQCDFTYSVILTGRVVTVIHIFMTWCCCIQKIHRAEVNRHGELYNKRN